MENITKKKNGKPKKDLRSVRSCKEIANALATLLQEKLFEDISVTDIVNKANVSRNTLYNNFQTKEDILLFLFEDYAKKLYSLFDEVKENDLESFKTALKEATVITVEFFNDSGLNLEKIIKKDARKSFYWILKAFSELVIRRILLAVPRPFNDRLEEESVVIYYSGAIASILYFLPRQEGNITKEKKAKILYRLLTESWVNVLTKSFNPSDKPEKN